MNSTVHMLMNDILLLCVLTDVRFTAVCCTIVHVVSVLFYQLINHDTSVTD